MADSTTSTSRQGSLSKALYSTPRQRGKISEDNRRQRTILLEKGEVVITWDFPYKEIQAATEAQADSKAIGSKHDWYRAADRSRIER